ncbi:MAG TPA: amine dehydrogenase large subunit [Pyrinomonadaceae bacterium]
MRSIFNIAKSKKLVVGLKSVGIRFSGRVAPIFCILLAVFCAPCDVSAGVQSGLVYVLDSGGGNGKSQVLVVDPEQKRIVRRFGTEHNPDMAVAPDGGRLYVAYSVNENGKLDIYDTVSGNLLRTVENKDRWLPTSHLYISHMALSPDGKWLYIFKYEIQTDLYYIATFDTAQERFLPEIAPLPECLNAIMSPSAEGRQLAVMCTSSDDLRFVKVMDDGKGRITRLPLRLRGRTTRFGLPIGLSNVLPTQSSYKIVAGDGSFFEVSGGTKSIKRLGVLDAKGRKITYSESPSLIADKEDWIGGKWLPIQYPAIAPKSGKVYLGMGQLADLRMGRWTYNTIGVFDIDTLNRVSLLETKHRLFSISVNPTGSRLYGVDPLGKRLVVFDTGSGSEIGLVEDLGESPMLVIAAP